MSFPLSGRALLPFLFLPQWGLFASSPAGLAVLPEAQPVVDGRLLPGEWDRALALGSMQARGEADFPETKVWASYDSAALYIAVRCEEPQMDRIRLNTLAEERKAPVWNDDSVEVFLDTGGTGRTVHHLVVNLNGTFYDSMVIAMREVPSAWDSNVQVRTSRSDSHWEIEIALPWDSLKHRLNQGEVFGLNVGRNRHTTDTSQAASLAAGHYMFPQHFRRLLVQGPLEVQDYQLISTRRGPFLEGEAGVWEFEALKTGREPLSLSTSFPLEPGHSAQAHRLSPEERFISIPFPKEKAAERRSLTLATGENKPPLFESEYAFLDNRPPARVATTRDPLFEALLEPNPEGLSKNGFLIWPHELMRPLMEELPLRTAFASDAEAPYRQYGKDGAILFLTGAVLTPERLALFDRHGISVAYCLDSRRALPPGTPTHPKYRQPWVLDPRAVESYLVDARKAIRLAKEHPCIRFIAAGDETWEVMHRNLLRMLDRRDEHPELKKADEEIRSRYGFGRFGLPESSTDPDPYRWISTYRWEIDQMLDLYRKVREMIREEGVDLKLMSWDSVNGMRPYGISRWSEVFDILLHQLYPSSNARREEFGAQTRFYTDLGQGAENWPVPHVEHYGGNFTADEVAEYLSQCLRNGASGFGIYAEDTVAARAGKGSPVTDRIGAPERWQVISTITQQMARAPFRVKMPKADTGIFYSTPSVQASGTGEGHALQFRNHQHGEWLFTILGSRLHSSLAFLDEHLATREPQSLTSYKVIYLPYIPIADDAEYRALEAYVAEGGNLIVCDPNAFAHRSDGTRREEGALLPPLGQGAAFSAKEMVYKDLIIRSIAPVHRLEPLKGDVVLATYPAEKAPALVQRSVGKGSIIFMAENPVRSTLIDDASWLRLFAALQKETGAERGDSVWRFRIPTPTPEATDPNAPVCLTGNGMEWRASEPRARKNARTKGSYRLSASDDEGREPAEKLIPFGKGRLTDRIEGAKAANDLPGTHFTLFWKELESLEVSYHFEEAVSTRKLQIFYAESLPAGALEVSEDGKEWKTLTEWDEQRLVEKKEVAVLSRSFPASEKASIFRIRFANLDHARLVEIELWGDES